ncbi:hypothetical protein Tsubulata_032609 [Turnera subulata]|uniref:Uncharacterized protein n=1 Tax=Turnera subulata TaxID=218843 RepID=A0A9Q0F3T7_9ROSI|nr:hypothetical protein Tsubulata_032609 [Turnera subulata]
MARRREEDHVLDERQGTRMTTMSEKSGVSTRPPKLPARRAAVRANGGADNSSQQHEDEMRRPTTGFMASARS